MKTFIEDGDVLELVASGTIASGDIVLVGSLLGVAHMAAVLNDKLSVSMRGVFTLPKLTGTAWAEGDDLYYDSSAVKVTKVSQGNTYAGIAAAAAASGDATGSVLINAPRRAKLPGSALAFSGAFACGSLAANTVSDTTMTVTGAAVGDVVALGPPAAPVTGVLFNGFVSATDTVTVRAGNVTAGGHSVGTITISGFVLKL